MAVSVRVFFKDELAMIKNEDLRFYLGNYLEMEVDTFEIRKPTSSTGKYHPSFQNTVDGNGKHTKHVVEILKVFERARPDLNWDELYAAAILHDLSKYEKETSTYTDPNHAEVQARRFLDWCKYQIKKNHNIPKKYMKQFKRIARYVSWHNGRFDPRCSTKEQIKIGYVKGMFKKLKWIEECYILHYADMISASKSLHEFTISQQS